MNLQQLPVGEARLRFAADDRRSLRLPLCEDLHRCRDAFPQLRLFCQQTAKLRQHTRRNEQPLAVHTQQRRQMLHQRRELLVEQGTGVDQEGVARRQPLQILLRLAPAVLLTTLEKAQQSLCVRTGQQSAFRLHAALAEQRHHALFVESHGSRGLTGRDRCSIHHDFIFLSSLFSDKLSDRFQSFSGLVENLFQRPCSFCLPSLSYHLLFCTFQGQSTISR